MLSRPPTISSTLSCANVKFGRALEIFQCLRKKQVNRKSFVWLPWQLFDKMVPIIVKMFTKTGNFQMLPETTNFKVSK